MSTPQIKASHPAYNVFVSAHAGCGKTHVLVARVIRLMLAGTPPQKILCLTFTRAAASEMAERLFGTLSAWISLEDEALKEALCALGETPSEKMLMAARCLFARAIETPGGLKVQTIHAFCERLLQRFPVESGAIPGFSVFDELQARTCLKQCLTQIAAEGKSTPAMQTCFETLVRHTTEEDLLDLLRELTSSRFFQEGGLDDPDLYEKIAREVGQITENPPALPVLLFSIPFWQDTLNALIRHPGASNNTQAESVRAILASLKVYGAQNEAHGDLSLLMPLFQTFFFTSSVPQKPKAQLVTKALQKENEALFSSMQGLQEAFYDWKVQSISREIYDATTALLKIAACVLSEYQKEKTRRACLDYDDLIVFTQRLLKGYHAAFVLYKLDGGLDHILIDEAQDTSPQQWEILSLLSEEFFAGEGSRSETPRTLFAVGDPKQSIFSFQGADLKSFLQRITFFSKKIQDAGLPFAHVPLAVSFRSSEVLLEATDQLLALPEMQKGVISSPQEEGYGAQSIPAHQAYHQDMFGVVELWPPVMPQASEPPKDLFMPPREPFLLDHLKQQAATRIAQKIKGWMDCGQRLAPLGRPICYQDILILVRQRTTYMEALVQALRLLDLPVSGADRLKITDHLAIQDLMALGNFCLFVEDDLSLAQVLKSPLVALDHGAPIGETVLLHLTAPPFNVSLWERLRQEAPTLGLSNAVIFLEDCLKNAQIYSPFAFYSTLFSQGSYERLLAQLGTQAKDPLEEWLNLTLVYEQRGDTSLRGFLCWVYEECPEIRRDFDQKSEEIRVMTIHGAKGLEANIVILADACDPYNIRKDPKLVFSAQAPFVPLWRLNASHYSAKTQDMRGLYQKAALEEMQRLLYVAMTRPRHGFYVTGYTSKMPLDPSCFYEWLKKALEENLTAIAGEDGEIEAWRMTGGHVLHPKALRINEHGLG